VKNTGYEVRHYAVFSMIASYSGHRYFECGPESCYTNFNLT